MMIDQQIDQIEKHLKELRQLKAEQEEKQSFQAEIRERLDVLESKIDKLIGAII